MDGLLTAAFVQSREMIIDLVASVRLSEVTDKSVKVAGSAFSQS